MGSKSTSPSAQCQSCECIQVVCQVVCLQCHSQGVLLLIIPMCAMLLLFPASRMLRRLTSLSVFPDVMSSEKAAAPLDTMCTEETDKLMDTHRLLAQCSLIALDDWKDESKHDLENIMIWHAWLSFKTKSEIESQPLVRGAEHFLVPPCRHGISGLKCMCRLGCIS